MSLCQKEKKYMLCSRVICNFRLSFCPTLLRAPTQPTQERAPIIHSPCLRFSSSPSVFRLAFRSVLLSPFSFISPCLFLRAPTRLRGRLSLRLHLSLSISICVLHIHLLALASIPSRPRAPAHTHSHTHPKVAYKFKVHNYAHGTTLA